MPETIRQYCRQTGQPEPDGAGGDHARDSREPGVQIPRWCSSRSSELTGRADRRSIRIVGGGSRQSAPESIHRGRDAAGGDRRTGRGDRARQHRDADGRDRRGRIARRRAARRSSDRFRCERYEPSPTGPLGRRVPPVPGIHGVHLCLRRRLVATKYLAEPLGRASSGGARRRSRSSCCATARTCSAPICGSPTSAAATPARSSSCPIR